MLGIRLASNGLREKSSLSYPVWVKTICTREADELFGPLINTVSFGINSQYKDPNLLFIRDYHHLHFTSFEGQAYPIPPPPSTRQAFRYKVERWPIPNRGTDTVAFKQVSLCFLTHACSRDTYILVYCRWMLSSTRLDVNFALTVGQCPVLCSMLPGKFCKTSATKKHPMALGSVRR